MFIRPCYRMKNGKRHAYWALMESYRTERGPRQRVVAYLGRLDEAERLGVKQAAEGKRDFQQTLFPKPEPRWVEVDTSAVRVENCRSFGGVWLAWELIRKLGLDQFLKRTIPTGREDVPWSVTALILVIARLCEPSSELHIAEHMRCDQFRCRRYRHTRRIGWHEHHRQAGRFFGKHDIECGAAGIGYK